VALEARESLVPARTWRASEVTDGQTTLLGAALAGRHGFLKPEDGNESLWRVGVMGSDITEACEGGGLGNCCTGKGCIEVANAAKEPLGYCGSQNCAEGCFADAKDGGGRPDVSSGCFWFNLPKLAQGCDSGLPTGKVAVED
jgi:hypothetical protein